MKKIFMLVVIILLFTSCSENTEINKNFNNNKIDNNIEIMYNPNLKDNSPKKTPIIKRVGVSEFENAIKTGEYTIIDLRTLPELKETGVLSEGITQIDFYSPNIQKDLLALDPDEKYLIYCRSGSRSNATLGFMKESGFKNVLELEGGIGAWENAGKEFIDYNNK